MKNKHKFFPVICTNKDILMVEIPRIPNVHISHRSFQIILAPLSSCPNESTTLFPLDIDSFEINILDFDPQNDDLLQWKENKNEAEYNLFMDPTPSSLNDRPAFYLTGWNILLLCKESAPSPLLLVSSTKWSIPSICVWMTSCQTTEEHLSPAPPLKTPFQQALPPQWCLTVVRGLALLKLEGGIW